ncbi:MAG: hypothetical protein QXE64_00640 [Candidatus Pacearchaeota archaeon]
MGEREKEIIEKYSAIIEKELRTELKESVEYLKFKEEALPMLSTYERAVTRFSFIKPKLSQKARTELQKAIEIAHLNITPEQAAGFAFSCFILIFIFTLLLFVFLISFTGFTIGQAFLIAFLLISFGLFVYYYLSTKPKNLALQLRLKASSQMVPCILYIVVYMRHTSNLERAIKFASDHLQPPLALDLKKVFWDVETGKFSTIKDSLDSYLESWRDFSLEFIEAFHLIESSLYEPQEARRIAILEKSLEVILDGVFEKMLHYTHDVKSPITNLYMLGIVLPTLGLALLPLASTLLQGALKWYHVAIIFNLILPFLVYYMTISILSKRPGGYGETELLERNPKYAQYISKKPYVKAFLLSFPLFLIGIIPLLFLTPLPTYLGLQHDYNLSELGLGGQLANLKLFDYKKTETGINGPFSIFALILSLFVPLSIALFFSIVYKEKTKELIETRNKTKALEKEFASSLFQFGNRLADGIPAEIAFGRVAATLKGTPTGEFFSYVNFNIQQFGMSVEQAIFSRERGAIKYFPSDLIMTAMSILIESVKKGLQAAARAMMSISQYVKNIHSIGERLKDLLADITSGMRSNMVFLAPLLSAIVVGLAGMITQILNQLLGLIMTEQVTESVMFGISAETITKLFNVSVMIPPYALQIIVGIYMIEIIFILTKALVMIEAGEDRLKEKYELALGLRRAMLLYFVTALISIIALSALAAISVSGLVG